MREDEKLVTIERFETAFDAELAKLALNNAGIECIVLGDNLPVNLPEIEVIRLELQVFECDVEKAKQVLAEREPLEDDESDAAEE